MTAKEKAIILHDKMFVNSKSIGGAFTDWELAKQLALIAVEEQISLLLNLNTYMAFPNQIIYLQEIKQEIEEL